MSISLGIVGGGGWLGAAIARAALRHGVVEASSLTLSWRSRKPEDFTGAKLTQDNHALLESAEVILLAVRPEDWQAVALPASGKLVVSVMAGVDIATLSDRHQTARVIRALPNAAAEVEASYTPIVASSGATDADRVFARALFGACGEVDELNDEAQLDYLSGLTGTGPAYPALMARAMVEDATARGLPENVARRAVNTLFVGAGRLIEKHDPAPSDTVETFMAYRGVTAAGLSAMQASGLTDAVRAGLSAALARTLAMRDAGKS